MNHDFDDDDSLELEDLAKLCGMEPDCILQFSRTRVISLHASGRAGVRTLHRLRRISSLQNEHGIDSATAAYMLTLLDRLEAANRELRILRERL